MLSRRSFLIAGLSMSVLAPARGMNPVGVRGVKELAQQLSMMVGIPEGQGALLSIIVAPGCDRASELWSASRSVVSQMKLRWIPTALGHASDQPAVAACLQQGTPEAVRALLIDGEASPLSVEGNLAQVRRQDGLYVDSVARLLWESTGRTPTIPTLVYDVPGYGTQVVRGAIPEELFVEIAGYAG